MGCGTKKKQLLSRSLQAAHQYDSSYSCMYCKYRPFSATQPLIPPSSARLCMFSSDCSLMWSANHAAARLPRPRDEPIRLEVSTKLVLLVSTKERRSWRLAGKAGRRLTAVPDDLTNASSLEESVQRGDRRIEALGGQVDGALDGAALRSGQNGSCKPLEASSVIDAVLSTTYLVVGPPQINKHELVLVLAVLEQFQHF
jgi:hypothetical protein